MGATMAGLVSTVPQIVWLSQYKGIVFTLSGAMILGSGVLHYKNRNAPCPIDPILAQACTRARVTSFWLLIVSGTLWCLGAFFAFVAPLVF